MKKFICISIALIMVLLLAPSALAAYPEMSVDLKGRTDVLDQEMGMLNAPANENKVDSGPRMTDGIFCKPMESSQYFNQKLFSSEASAGELEPLGGTYEFTLVDGTVNKYFYEIQWYDLDCDVNSFAIYFSNEKDYTTGEAPVPWWQCDSAFDILVSQDGGTTWSVAWKSIRFTTKTDADGNTVIDTCSAWTIDQGGDWTHVEKSTDTEFYWYRFIEGNFDKEYKGVTNIAYGCVNPRRASEKDASDIPHGTPRPFYYVARITEFDVYGKNNKAAEETTPEETTAGQVEDTTAAQVVDTTAAQVEDTSAAPVENTEGEAAVTSKAPEEPKDGKGCSSSVAFAGVAAVMALGCVVLRKRKD